MIPTVYADAAPSRAPVLSDEVREAAVFDSERSLTFTVTEEEAEALMAVLLLAPLEGGRTGDAMERVLSKLADIQRAFSRAAK